MSSVWRMLFLAPLLLLSSLPRNAAAQLAPIGDHYAGRASDTGFSGGVTGNGGYSASVPLDLPTERGGLPIPLSIVYTGHGFGAAGRAWDMPLSAVVVDRSRSHRRPRPFGRATVKVSLLGRTIELLPKDGAWVAQADAPGLTAREEPGKWLVHDGAGHTYTFAAMATANVWLLTSISGSGSSRVEIEYSPQNVLNSGIAPDVKRIRYNWDGGSFKHEIEPVFDEGQPGKSQSAFVLAGSVFVRYRRLIAVEVHGRPSGGGELELLRRYELRYEGDPDTSQPRLASVWVTGRGGSGLLPVASYEYGSATSAPSATTRALRYVKTQSIALPADAEPRAISQTLGNATTQSLVDVTGDGRPDLVFRKDNGPFGLMVARNRPGGNGVPRLDDAGMTGTLNDAVMHLLDVGTYESGIAVPPSDPVDTGVAPQHDVWRRLIDMNGDGRLDIVDAKEKANTWVIYYNEPANDYPWNTKWKRAEVSVAARIADLKHRGFTQLGDRLPLERRHTGRSVQRPDVCYLWDDHDGWELYSLLPCPDFEGELHPPQFGGAQTFTEWELKDFNGDGYPDFIMNSSPIDHVPVLHPPQAPPYSHDALMMGSYDITVRPQDPYNQILVAYNASGVILPMFLEPVPVANAPTCGVGMSIGEDLAVRCTNEDCTQTEVIDENNGRQVIRCEIADVNGDGLADYIDGPVARIGTGAGLSNVTVTFDDEDVSRREYFTYSNHAYRDCAPPVPANKTFSPGAISTLRDLTGDGIPDRIYLGNRTGDGGPWRVEIGTGTGFAPPIPIDGPFSITAEEERCDGAWSRNTGGLMDLDGDGKPEVVKLVNGALDVYQLVGSSGPRALDAGRLVAIENGYGARTTITYRSAKDDATTPHQVPSAEIVVGAVETRGTRDLGLGSTRVSYAYGGATLMFDSFADGFRFPGYARTIELVAVPGREPIVVNGTATVTDTYQPAPITGGEPLKELFARHLRAGRVRDVTVLSGELSPDPWAMLTVDLGTDPRQISGTHTTWDAQAFADATPSGPTFDCQDIHDPYCDLPGGGVCFASNAMDVCKTRGFLYGSGAYTWRGASFPSATERVVTMTRVTGVDGLGRVTKVAMDNDLMRPDDDLCVETEYAAPTTGAYDRVLSAPKARYVGECNADGTRLKTLSAEFWEYDHLPIGYVAEGYVTTHWVDRYDPQSGVRLGSARELRVSHDALGRPIFVTSQRGDGATRSTVAEYDSYGLAVEYMRTEATGAAPLETTITRDPVTLDALSVLDPNGTARGATFDDFGRQVLATVAPPGGAAGALSLTTYLGFGGGDPMGRRVVSKTFRDPVPPDSAASAAGRTTTAYLDEAGRRRFVEVSLGSDYGDGTLVVGAHLRDALGRVSFAADPFPLGQNLREAYGTTQHFNIDGTPSCTIRGYGPQPFADVTDEASERYPTCYERRYEDNREIVGVYTADALLAGSPQSGVGSFATLTAIGRVLERSTWRNGARLERADFSYDRLGNRIGLTRWGNPSGPSLPVQWSSRYDSLGQLLSHQEPESVPTLHTYDDWGALVEVLSPASASPASPERRQVMSYDGAGRLIHREERIDGVVDPETIADYEYDVGVSISSEMAATHTLGRLARASAPAGEVYLGYDAFGRVQAKAYTDDSEESLYIQKSTYHGDGSLASLELLLPDSATWEKVHYSYDSAGRTRSVLALDGASSTTLYAAQVVDLFGRARSARVGGVDVTADYAEVGRRLLREVAISSSAGARVITPHGYDPVGRERGRDEQLGGGVMTTTVAYDALGRLDSSKTTQGATTLSHTSFNYDSLGNIGNLNDLVGNSDVVMTYSAGDPDRLCHVTYDNVASGTACNVSYDAEGRIVEQATRGGYRRLEYYASGDVRGIRDQNGTAALLRYGALGGVQELDVRGNGIVDARRDRRYGGLIERRDELFNGGAKSFISRNIPTPGGVASRRGLAGPWIFEIGEQRGDRFFVDGAGAFIQDVGYKPYGEATSTGAAPGSKLYSTAQWNGGDALAAFNLSHLGARLYDPVIGRFLSRDPLLVPRTATTTNPYAFAANDPINRSDPSGLDWGTACTGGWGKECQMSSGDASPWGLLTMTPKIREGLARRRAHHQPQPPYVPHTPDGRWLQRKYGHLTTSTSINWDNVATFKFDSYDEWVDFLQGFNAGSYRPYWDDWNNTVDFAENMTQLGLFFAGGELAKPIQYGVRGTAAFLGGGARAATRASSASGVSVFESVAAEVEEYTIEHSMAALRAEMLGGERVWLVGEGGASTTRGYRFRALDPARPGDGYLVTADTMTDVTMVHEDVGALSNILGSERPITMVTGAHGGPGGGALHAAPSNLYTNGLVGRAFGWTSLNALEGLPSRAGLRGGHLVCKYCYSSMHVHPYQIKD